MSITPQQQLDAVDAIESGARAALAYLHDQDRLGEHQFSLEASEVVARFMTIDEDHLTAGIQTFCEALASADVLGERLGKERGELLDAALESLRVTYRRWADGP